jgi:hypothetical protein
MAFLEDLVHRDERFECLDLIGENWLPKAAVSRGPAEKVWRVGAGPTLSCPARKTLSSCDPMCRQCKLAHAFLYIKLSAGGVSVGAQTYA